MATKVAGLFFAVFAVVHGIRIAKAWEVTIGGTSIAMWVSYVAIGVSVFMSYALLKGPRKRD